MIRGLYRNVSGPERKLARFAELSLYTVDEEARAHTPFSPSPSHSPPSTNHDGQSLGHPQSNPMVRRTHELCSADELNFALTQPCLSTPPQCARPTSGGGAATPTDRADSGITKQSVKCSSRTLNFCNAAYQLQESSFMSTCHQTCQTYKPMS